MYSNLELGNLEVSPSAVAKALLSHVIMDIN
jgi:hypothetical protein